MSTDIPGWGDHTAAPRSEVRIGMPLAFRVYVGIFAVIWCGGVLSGLIAALVKLSPAAVILAVMLAFGGFIMWHMFRLAVIGDHEGLTVRGYYRSRRIPKFEIEGFRIGIGYYPFGKCIFALVRDQEVIPLDVTRRAGLLPWTRRRLENQLQDLSQWLATP